MTEITTDLRKSQINYISSSLCTTSATDNNSNLPQSIVFPGAQPLKGQIPLNTQYHEKVLQTKVQCKQDSLSPEISESYARVLKENKDVLLLLAK